MKFILLIAFPFLLLSCATQKDLVTDDLNQFQWGNATIYFLLTDRFFNADKSNDIAFERKKDGAVLRSFEGGDLKGITKKIEDGYFHDLGIDVLWFTPPFEQISSYTDEGTGKTYGYHGYWTRDWTSIDPNIGTISEFRTLVETAHAHGIRILLDAVLNHTGPVTEKDSQWPDTWVRTFPKCTFQDAKSTIACTLVENLPDIRTESNQEVEIPKFLKEKWTEENRYENEMAELNAFFSSTGHPRAPRFYIMKWLTDWVREFGIDGFRVDTAKHTEASVWTELYEIASLAFSKWKKLNPSLVLDDKEFFMTGEVYNYFLQGKRNYYFNPNDSIDFYANGFKSLINFSFKTDALKDYETLFSEYNNILQSKEMQGLSVINYISSHDDGGPFDHERKNPIEAGTKLLLTPGSVQIYYGDEIARPLIIKGANGDANLRSNMNWDDLDENKLIHGIRARDIFNHWSKLANFRKKHPAVGLGHHQIMSSTPYFFSRTYQQDKIVVGLDLSPGSLQQINVSGIFKEGSIIKDSYSNQKVSVENGKLTITSPSSILLLSAE